MNANDPNLTAYVLGELPETEMRKWQALLDENPELRHEAEAIRATVVEIETAMQLEPLPAKEVEAIPLAETPASSCQWTGRRLWFSALASVAVLFVGLLVALPFLPRPAEEIAPHAGVALHDAPLKQVAVAEERVLQETHANPAAASGATELDAVESNISGSERLSQENLRERDPEDGSDAKKEKMEGIEKRGTKDGRFLDFDDEMSLSSRSSMVDTDGKPDGLGSMGMSEAYSNPTSQMHLGGSSDDAISLKFRQEQQSPVFLENVARPMVASKEGRVAQEQGESLRRSDTFGLPDAETGGGRAAVMSVPSSVKESSSTEHAQPDIIEGKGLAKELHGEVHDGFFFQSNFGQPAYSGKTESEKSKENAQETGDKPVPGTHIASSGTQEYLRGGRIDASEGRLAVPMAAGKPTSAAAPMAIPRKASSAPAPPASLPVASPFAPSGSSVFSAPSVRTNAYDRLRDAIRQGRLPSRDEVRIEEYVNHFRYDHSVRATRRGFDNTLSRTSGDEVAGQRREFIEPTRKKRDDENRDDHVGQGPLAVHVEVAPCPWKADHLLALLTVSGSASTKRADHESRIVAQDVKIRINCNPQLVAACRLVGYENPFSRDGKTENTESQAVESADEPVEVETLRAGGQVCILYEIVPAPVSGNAASAPTGETPMELMSVKLLYAVPGTEQVVKFDEPVVYTADTTANVAAGVYSGAKIERGADRGSDDFRFAAAVALFGMLLRESPHVGDGDWDAAEKLARDAAANRPDRREFLELLHKARDLATQRKTPQTETAPAELEPDRQKE